MVEILYEIAYYGSSIDIFLSKLPRNWWSLLVTDMKKFGVSTLSSSSLSWPVTINKSLKSI